MGYQPKTDIHGKREKIPFGWKEALGVIALLLIAALFLLAFGNGVYELLRFMSEQRRADGK